ncbi:uncharacterized protein RHIMIDRAFT_278903 [Rhizopus microsporus ATCC 52813]|uniref:Uncharacterized protein n=1 Tax=Rhizopus microsporus ATCC 52813 TaxID=1340429 RepID=A0A2G4T013_RHIZD|nr:uncharacterized protein RHIMIDRAFT_278903 [Rhizopus microsporus ATCC 52813]PHZ14362.1 hypothetical protein RHIMIDRAFT_278903 [Rhizopus microsporus ATCC 52813]
MGSVSLGAGLGPGALEIGSRKNDSIRYLSDVYYKMPIVMKYIPENIVDKYASLRNDINIIGYSIQGEYNKLTFINMDTPAGYVTHVLGVYKRYHTPPPMMVILPDCLLY